MTQSIGEVLQAIYPHCKESILCPYAPGASGWCDKHAAIHGVKKTGHKKPIKKFSDKRVVENKALAKVVKEILKERPICEIQSPNCTKIAVAANHKQKRSPKNLTDKNNLESCCAECNLFIELNVQWAIDNGHQISRFIKV